MAQASEKTTGDASVPLPEGGDHDRVVMLSVKADGTPDQHNPEMIGDRKFAEEATRRQFTEQAVSAEDVRLRGVTAGPGAGAERVEQDPEIAKMQDAHKAAAEKAEKAADAAVDKLHQGLGDTDPDQPPGTPASLLEPGTMSRANDEREAAAAGAGNTATAGPDKTRGERKPVDKG